MRMKWINPEEFSFNCLLLMERFQIRLMAQQKENKEWCQNMAIALSFNPAVKWYVMEKCPECAPFFRDIIKNAPQKLNKDKIRQAEVFVLNALMDFVTYTKPEIMDIKCDFIFAWNEKRLLEMADFKGKRVLDVGSGSGRLAFAAAKQAKEVYASEPVDTLREYLRDKIARKKIRNMRVSDGMAHSLAYPDDTFDIVVSGHVVGDDYEGELRELERVVKPGGWLIDCPGDEPYPQKPNLELKQRGWEELYYVNALGGDTYRYRKQVMK